VAPPIVRFSTINFRRLENLPNHVFYECGDCAAVVLACSNHQTWHNEQQQKEESHTNELFDENARGI
jgi:hypothetical protein